MTILLAPPSNTRLLSISQTQKKFYRAQVLLQQRSYGSSKRLNTTTTTTTLLLSFIAVILSCFSLNRIPMENLFITNQIWQRSIASSRVFTPISFPPLCTFYIIYAHRAVFTRVCHTRYRQSMKNGLMLHNFRFFRLLAWQVQLKKRTAHPCVSAFSDSTKKSQTARFLCVTDTYNDWGEHFYVQFEVRIPNIIMEI